MLADTALAYAAYGWHVFPCAPNAKHPLTPNGYRDATTDPDTIRAWWAIWPDANPALALAPSGLVAIDADTYKPDCEWPGYDAATFTQRTGRSGLHMVFQAVPGATYPGTLCRGVEIKHNGYILLAGSVVDGNPYTVLHNAAPTPAPDWIPTREAGVSNTGLQAASVEDVASALSVIPNDAADWDWWSRVAGAVHNAGGTFEQFDAWSRQCPDYDERETRAKWQQVQRSPYKDVGMGTLFYMATQADPRWQRPSRVASVFNEDGLQRVGEAMVYDDERYGEDGLAVNFVQAMENRGRYVALWNEWLIYDSRIWRSDSTLGMYDAARKICRHARTIAKQDDALTESERKKILTSLRKGATIASVERIARSDRAVVADAEQWDTNIWLLNTPDGVVELMTGRMREHRPQDYMTKMTTVSPGGDCPLWLSFLNRVTDGDASLIGYLQRLAGYALTGSTREHVLPFAHGSGGNGKGVFIGTISKIMGDYHRAAGIETFAASNIEHHPTDLARLRGARLVTAQETEEGRRWAESRIKSLTGGDRISARFMRQDFFEYDPQFTLLIAGNHKPGLRSVDEAIRRRFHLIPFNVTIPVEERDNDFADKLRDEWSGILSWMIEGCLAWQREGLAPPPVILSATAAYLDGQDAIGAWLAESCDCSDLDAWSATNDLYMSFRVWAERAGEFVLPRARFLDALETRRLSPARHNNKRGFRGVQIVTMLPGR